MPPYKHDSTKTGVSNDIFFNYYLSIKFTKKLNLTHFEKQKNNSL